jgi:hypothetical protein
MKKTRRDVVPQKSNIIPLRFNLPGIKKLLLPQSADTDLLDTAAAPARAQFGPPTETAVAEKRSSLVDFLKQVTLFEDLSRWDLRRLARIVHERDYHLAMSPGGIEVPSHNVAAGVDPVG